MGLWKGQLWNLHLIRYKSSLCFEVVFLWVSLLCNGCLNGEINLQIQNNWTYGEMLDENAKTHPMLRPYKTFSEKVIICHLQAGLRPKSLHCQRWTVIKLPIWGGQHCWTNILKAWAFHLLRTRRSIVGPSKNPSKPCWPGSGPWRKPGTGRERSRRKLLPPPPLAKSPKLPRYKWKEWKKKKTVSSVQKCKKLDAILSVSLSGKCSQKGTQQQRRISYCSSNSIYSWFIPSLSSLKWMNLG